MQPQDPHNQTVNSTAPEPAPTTAEVQREEPAVVPPIIPQPVKKAPNKALIAAILGAVILIAAGVSAYFLFFSGIKLATYSGQNFSIAYPDGYEQKSAGEGSAIFVEKGDVNTASQVAVYYSAFPEELEQSQVDTYKNAIKEQLKSSMSEVTGDNITVKDVNVQDTTYKGQSAIQLTAKSTKEGKEDGSVKLVAVFDTKKFYMIVVAAHATDPGVASATDRILNSFSLAL